MTKLILALSILSLSIKAETLEEAVAKTTYRFKLRDDKKQKRDAVKAKYKGQISALRESQKQELKTISEAK